jgi:hypothetical protein
MNVLVNSVTNQVYPDKSDRGHIRHVQLLMLKDKLHNSYVGKDVSFEEEALKYFELVKGLKKDDRYVQKVCERLHNSVMFHYSMHFADYVRHGRDPSWPVWTMMECHHDSMNGSRNKKSLSMSLSLIPSKGRGHIVSKDSPPIISMSLPSVGGKRARNIFEETCETKIVEGNKSCYPYTFIQCVHKKLKTKKIGSNLNPVMRMQGGVEPPLAILESVEPMTPTQAFVDRPLAIREIVESKTPMQGFVEPTLAVQEIVEAMTRMQGFVEPTLAVQEIVESKTPMQGVVEPTLAVQEIVEAMTPMQGVVEPTLAVQEIVEAMTPMQECCGVKSLPIFYEPYKVLGADELVIRVLFEDTFYQISIHSASYKSALMSFQDILPYLQNKITDPLTTMELNMIPDTERETLTCEMYLVYEKVKGNPICETQKLLFHRYKTYSERGYEKEIKKFKTDIQRVETENHEMKLLINGHRDVVSNLESMLHEMHTQRSQLEQRLHQSEQHLKRFKDNILQVVYFNENPNESQRSVASEPTNEVALPTGAFCAEKKCESSV